jgi:glycosyltransferase involved in cell wall biosynthesis
MKSGSSAVALRVLFATDNIHFPQGSGGAERNTHELCLALKMAGAYPGVMSSISADKSWLSWNNRFLRKLPPFNKYPRDARCGYPVYRGWAPDGANEVVSRFRPDVVVIQSTHPDPLLRAFSDLGLPMLAYFHEVADINHLATIKQFSVHVLANSNFTAARLKAVCDLDSTVILPLVDPSRYVTESTRERVLFVNTVPRKGLEIAFALAEARPDIKFDFVLSWILRGEKLFELQARASRYSNIELHRPTDEMRKLYFRARLLLAPSLWEETWGRVVTEAHVNGIPVIASKRGGLPESVGPGGHIVAAEAPITDWISALSELWDDHPYYQKKAEEALLYSRRPEIQPENIAMKMLKALEAARRKIVVRI